MAIHPRVAFPVLDRTTIIDVSELRGARKQTNDIQSTFEPFIVAEIHIV